MPAGRTTQRMLGLAVATGVVQAEFVLVAIGMGTHFVEKGFAVCDYCSIALEEIIFCLSRGAAIDPADAKKYRNKA